MIDAVGLEDCGDLVAHATPAQLSHIFDIDLWKPARPGFDEQFDVDRFGVWLEVLADAGPEIAAEKLAGLPLNQLVAGFARYVRVFDLGAVIEFETTDGDMWDYSKPVRGSTGIEVGGYHVVARREDAWDAIVAVLLSLDSHQQDRFHELLRAVRSFSHATREEDGFHSLLDDREQMMFDIGSERERRREQRGFASPADARAFLQMSRAVKRETIASNPIAREYARAINTNPVDEAPLETTPEEMREVVELLSDAGVTALEAPRALLESGEPQFESRLHQMMQFVVEHDPVAYGDRNFELAYLANVLMTGSTIQSRSFTLKEATDGALAMCRLGLEELPDAPVDYFLANDIIGVFQLGWSMLHREVCVFAAEQLADTLLHVRIEDDDVQRSLNMLRVRLLRALDAGEPWRAAEALDVLTNIDLPAWAALVGVIAECPVIHAGLMATVDRSVKAVDPKAFEFISSRGQVDAVRVFMTALPGLFN